ncbi:hypothetical protein OUZ56_024224 [Daphnia magna]|uniref:Uncharacterized protein n=1 Tax=Daphnia magna TaxID=35525 RepID=A0ABR0B0D1_9CRUS|nr:hypothetical protein OUZ56_024224 [Daphnia magna]
MMENGENTKTLLHTGADETSFRGKKKYGYLLKDSFEGMVVLYVCRLPQPLEHDTPNPRWLHADGPQFDPGREQHYLFQIKFET